MKKLGIGVFCVCAYVWTWGASNADYEFYQSPPCNTYRKGLALTSGLSLLPPAWIVTPFLTGFYEHGWRLRPAPGCVDGQAGVR